MLALNIERDVASTADGCGLVSFGAHEGEATLLLDPWVMRRRTGIMSETARQGGLDLTRRGFGGRCDECLEWGTDRRCTHSLHVAEVRVNVLVGHAVMLGGAGVLGDARAAVGAGSGAIGAPSSKAIAGSIETVVLEGSILKLGAGLLGTKLNGG